MNTDDLRDELTRRAGEVDDARQHLLTGVHSKVTAKRRARAAGSVGAAALAVAALVLVPQVADDAAPPDRIDPAAPTSSSPSTPEQTTDPLVFPRSIDGDTLIDSAMNQPGQSTLTWRVVLDDLNVAISQFCRLPENTAFDPNARPLVGVHVAIDGRPAYGWSCVTAERPGNPASEVPWRSFGVSPRKPFTMSMWLERAEKRIHVPGTRFGLGLYARTGGRLHPDGVELRVIKDGYDGHRYRLADYRTQPVAEGRELTLVVPPSDQPVYLTYGWSARHQVGGMVAYLDGKPITSVTGGGLASGEVIQPTGIRHAVRVVAEGRVDSGVLVIAYYERIS